MQNTAVTGVILAGGQGRRMGGEDKGWVDFQGRPMIQHILERLSDQVDEVIIVANRNQTRYADLGVRVVEDLISGFQGPLVGIATGLTYASHDQVVFVPCDGPFISRELVNRFSEEFSNSGKPVIVADDGERLQPMVVMLQKQLLPELQSALQAGERKPDRWYAAMGMAQVSFAADSLYNFNTHEQITPKS